MVDTNSILNIIQNNGKLSTKQITDLISQKSPIPVPNAIVTGLLDQLVNQQKLSKTEENGETFYYL